MLAPFCDSFIVMAHQPALRVSIFASSAGGTSPHMLTTSTPTSMRWPCGVMTAFASTPSSAAGTSGNSPRGMPVMTSFGGYADAHAVTGQADRPGRGDRPGRVEVGRQRPAAVGVVGDVDVAGGGVGAPRLAVEVGAPGDDEVVDLLGVAVDHRVHRELAVARRGAEAAVEVEDALATVVGVLGEQLAVPLHDAHLVHLRDQALELLALQDDRVALAGRGLAGPAAPGQGDEETGPEGPGPCCAAATCHRVSPFRSVTSSVLDPARSLGPPGGTCQANRRSRQVHAQPAIQPRAAPTTASVRSSTSDEPRRQCCQNSATSGRRPGTSSTRSPLAS